MSDEIRRLSDVLASDPREPRVRTACRRHCVVGPPDVALRVVLRGLGTSLVPRRRTRCAARVYADLGERDRAKDEWEMALQLSAGHVGAMRGLRSSRFSAGRDVAERYLRDWQSVRRMTAHPLRAERLRAVPPPAVAEPVAPASRGAYAVAGAVSELLIDSAAWCSQESSQRNGVDVSAPWARS